MRKRIGKAIGCYTARADQKLGFPLFLFGVMVVFAAFVWCVWFAITGLEEGVAGIEDPTERGLAYVALAIFFHMLFGGGKTEVTVKKDDLK